MALALGVCRISPAQETYMFAQRDTCDLYLDIFRPSEGSQTTFQGIEKPAVLHVFGGGFIEGERSGEFIRKWAQTLNDDGYTLITVDYRLGMKDYSVGKGLLGALKASDRFLLSQNVGVEDVLDAVKYLCAHSSELGIDPANIVLAGSSAGAIITLACVKAIACGEAPGLPEGFSFKGAMSFAGAIISTSGAPKFTGAPCPLLLMHGTIDKAVAYNHYGFLGRGIWGSSWIARQLSRSGFTHCIYRFKDRGHDAAAYHHIMWPVEKQFLEENVILGHRRNVDALVDDDSLPSDFDISLENIYK